MKIISLLAALALTGCASGPDLRYKLEQDAGVVWICAGVPLRDGLTEREAKAALREAKQVTREALR